MKKDFGRDSTMIRICVAGATGRMGSTVIKEAVGKNFQIVGAVAASGEVNIGKSLREIGICDSDIRVVEPTKLNEAVKDADVYMTFTTPNAEVLNIPLVANSGRRIVLGTTGFTEEQRKRIEDAVSGRVPAVISPNFAMGVNILFKLTQILRAFPPEYNFSVTEIHHVGKKDAPSGTAKKLGEIISTMRNYSKVVYGREGISARTSQELEVASLRIGGIPGIHDLIVAGPYEMLRIEHTAFSRSVFAQGALYAAEWICKQNENKIYSMEDVLGLS
jgi:4-hydroxy-tetrahydrodipicolinate reductase